MKFFTSSELGSIVADYDERNGTTIDTELELMSALATAGVRCSGGINALQEYLLDAYTKQRQRETEKERWVVSRKCHVPAASHTVLSPRRGGGAAEGCRSSSISPRAGGHGGKFSIAISVASDPQQQQSQAVGGLVRCSSSSLGNRHETPLPYKDDGKKRLSNAVATRRSISPLAPGKPSPGIMPRSGDDTTPQATTTAGGGGALLVLSSRRSHPIAAVAVSGHTPGRSAVYNVRSSIGRSGGMAGHGTSMFDGEEEENDVLPAPPAESEMSSWMRLELPMESATFVRLLIGLKTFLCCDVIEEALDGGRGGVDTSGGSAVAVLDRALATVAERASSPETRGQLGMAVDLLDLGEEEEVQMRDTCNHVEESRGGDLSSPTRRVRGPPGKRGTSALAPVPNSSNSPGDGRASSGIIGSDGVVPEHVLKQFSALPAVKQAQRLEALRDAVCAYRAELLHVLEHASNWGTNFGSTVGRSGGRLPRCSSFLDDDGGGGGAISLGGSASMSFGSFSMTSPSRLALAAAAPPAGNNLGDVVQRVMRGFQLDPAHVMHAYHSFCLGGANDGGCAERMKNHEEDEGSVPRGRGSVNSSVSGGSPVTSPNLAPTASASPQHPTGKFPLAAGVDERRMEGDNVHDFTSWLLHRQERMIQELDRIVHGITSTDDPHHHHHHALGPAAGFSSALGATPQQHDEQQHPRSLLAHRRLDAPHHLLGLSPILDEHALNHTMSGVVDAHSFEGRTPRKGDERLSGLSPLDRIVERHTLNVRQLREIVPLELQFPFVASVVNKNHRRVTTSDEMLHDICSSLPHTNVYRVGTALRQRRDGRLHPLDHKHHRGHSSSSVMSRVKPMSDLKHRLTEDDEEGLARHAQAPSTPSMCGTLDAAVTPPLADVVHSDAPPSTADAELTNASLDPLPAREGDREEPPLHEQAAALDRGSTGSSPTAAPRSISQQQLLPASSSLVMQLTTELSCSRTADDDDEQRMSFWLQGGVPHPAPLSPAKLVQQRRRAAQEQLHRGQRRLK